MVLKRALMIAAFSMLTGAADAGQAPGAATAADTPISHQDRVYTADQFSNTVSVSDPVDNKLIGVIRLGDTQPRNFSPLYKGQVLVHGMGFSPDHKTLAIVAIGSNSVTFIDTETATVKHTTYVGRSPHEAFFTPDGKEVWVTVRGEDYISVLSTATFGEIARIKVPAGPDETRPASERPAARAKDVSNLRMEYPRKSQAADLSAVCGQCNTASEKTKKRKWNDKCARPGAAWRDGPEPRCRLPRHRTVLGCACVAKMQHYIGAEPEQGPT